MITRYEMRDVNHGFLSHLTLPETPAPGSFIKVSLTEFRRVVYCVYESCSKTVWIIVVDKP